MPRPRFKHFALLVAAIGLLAAGLYASTVRPDWLLGRDSDSFAADAEGRVLAVDTLVARRTPSYRVTRSLTGIVKARRAGDLSFSRPGRLMRIAVDQGERVAAGDLLAELDIGRLTQQKAALVEARERANVQLARLVADARLRSMEAMRVEVFALRSELARLNEEVKRLAAAAEEGAASQPGVPPSTRERLEGARQRIGALDATSRDPQVEAQQGVVADLSQQIAKLDVEIEQGTLRAPHDGVVAVRYVSEGIPVAPSVRIVRIVEQSALQVWVSLPADAAEEVGADREQVVEVGGRKFNAVLFTKSPELDQTTRTRTAVFTLDESASEEVLPGEVARIEIDRQVESAGFWLPVTSLTREAGGLWSVYLVAAENGDGQIVARRYVEVEHLDGERARVTGTIAEGDLIVADGTHRVVPGQRVEPVATPESMDAEERDAPSRDSERSR